MLSRGGKRLENDPSVSQIDNFYKVLEPLLSLMSRNLRLLLIVVFLNHPKKLLLIYRAWQWTMQKHKLLFMLSVNSLTCVKTDLRSS